MRERGRYDPYDTRDNAPGWIAGWALRQFVIWSCVGLGIYLAATHRAAWLPASSGGAAPAEQHETPSAAAVMRNSLVYRADSNGHVRLTAEVNGTPVRFMVDTGATFVVLTVKDAEAAGIGPGDLVFDAPVSTANGRAFAARVTLRELRLEQLSVYDVPAMVGRNLGSSLLGQSFLTRLDSYEMRDGGLTMNW